MRKREEEHQLAGAEGAGGAAPDPLVTVIVPTRNEAGNVEELVRRLDEALSEWRTEILFVDDSDDETPERISEIAAGSACRVRLLHRSGPQRCGGLGGAVLCGMRASASDLVVVLDGDLQHPPELVPVLLSAAMAENADVVVGSRHCGDGATDGLSSWLRLVVSNSATTVAKVGFPRRLSGTTDPMSGFFVLRRSAVDLDVLRPVGFKILLEVLVRTPCLRVTERPFVFADRYSGESKANLVEGLRFTRQMLLLRTSTLLSGRTGRAVGFGLVGVTGIAVNTLAFLLLISAAGVHYLTAALLATQASTLWNFVVAERLVFPGSKHGSWHRRFLANVAVNNAVLLLRLPMLALLVGTIGVGEVIGNVLTLLTFFLIRFFILDGIVYRREGLPMTDSPASTRRPRSQPVDVVVDVRSAIPEQTRRRPVSASGRSRYVPYRYDIHQLLTIGSEVPLKELEYFRAPQLSGPFDIEIRAGRVGRGARRRAQVTQTATGVRYEEHLGGRGADFDVELGPTIHVTVGKLLVASPHVLYTNVIEALLRFVLVSRGHMLLHSACLDLEDGGVMLSARTDTGKTGTILRLLSEGHGRFLADDMTVIDSSGTAYSFPKPLTISHHTLRAVNAGELTRREWRKLRMQSRLHSKEGRNIGQRLGDMNLPIMALNALTQWLVPPPKYVVDRLVDCKLTTQTKVRDLFIIERAPHNLAAVPFDEAIDALIENTDDAYGFPPFRYFAPALVIGEDGYEVLRLKERQILEDAMRHVRIRRLSADDFSWADRIPGLASEPREGLVDVDVTDAHDERVIGVKATS